MFTLLLTLAVIAVIAVALNIISFEVLDLFLTVVGGGGLIGLWGLRSKIRNWLFKRTYRQKLEEAKLEEM